MENKGGLSPQEFAGVEQNEQPLVTLGESKPVTHPTTETQSTVRQTEEAKPINTQSSVQEASEPVEPQPELDVFNSNHSPSSEEDAIIALLKKNEEGA